MPHPLLEQVDWAREETAAVELLQALVRFETVNPPGEEAALIDFLAERLRADGIEPVVLTAAPGRANLVARLPARDGDGGAGPLLLNGHVDVVAAEADRWRHPPFAGEIHDGWLWGRGTVDMKHMVAMSVAVMGLLARLGAPLRRDLVLAAVADEENGCAFGSAWLVDHHPDLVRAEHALGEVGGFTLWFGDRPVYPVQVAEKGICWLKATATGATGHGSVPRRDNAVVRLARFVERLGRHKLPLRPSPEVDRFITALAEAQSGAARKLLPLVADPRVPEAVRSRLLGDRPTTRTLDAVLRDTATPTVLRAGGKTNVIPGRAEAEIDGRIAIGSSEAAFLAELRRLAGPWIDLEVLGSFPPTTAPADNDVFATLGAVVAEHHPGAVAVPSITPGFTDAKFWSRLGTACYGFAPVRLEPDGPAYLELFHGDDERVPVDGFKAGLRMLADAVARLCVADGVA